MNKIKIYSNFNSKPKWKGVIDYRVGGFLIGYVCFVYQILSAFNVTPTYIVYVIVLSFIPLFGIYVVLSKEDNMPHMMYNIISYLVKPKKYIFDYSKKSYVSSKKIYKSCKSK